MCIYIYMYTSICICVTLDMYTCIYVYMYICIYIYVCMLGIFFKLKLLSIQTYKSIRVSLVANCEANLALNLSNLYLSWLSLTKLNLANLANSLLFYRFSTNKRLQHQHFQKKRLQLNGSIAALAPPRAKQIP